jgi:hypothetical protein
MNRIIVHEPIARPLSMTTERWHGHHAGFRDPHEPVVPAPPKDKRGMMPRFAARLGKWAIPRNQVMAVFSGEKDTMSWMVPT